MSDDTSFLMDDPYDESNDENEESSSDNSTNDNDTETRGDMGYSEIYGNQIEDIKKSMQKLHRYLKNRVDLSGYDNQVNQLITEVQNRAKEVYQRRIYRKDLVDNILSIIYQLKQANSRTEADYIGNNRRGWENEVLKRIGKCFYTMKDIEQKYDELTKNGRDIRETEKKQLKRLFKGFGVEVRN